MNDKALVIVATKVGAKKEEKRQLEEACIPKVIGREEQNQEMVKCNRVVERNYYNGGDRENSVRDLIVSKKHPKKMVLVMLVEQE